MALHRVISLSLLLVAAPAVASADTLARAMLEAGEAGDGDLAPMDLTAALGDREIGASLGVVTGSDNTVGGMRVSGRLLYQLSDRDWFEGGAAFTYGGGAAGCVAPEADPSAMSCEHGRLSGTAVELTAGVRRTFGARDAFVPYLRGAVGVRVLHFAGDQLTGAGIPLIAAGGVRARVAPRIAVGAEAAVEGGVAYLSRGVGATPQLGMVIGGQVEFELR
jgi:hypothetical protein